MPSRVPHCCSNVRTTVTSGAHMHERVTAKPFVKWVGGKRSILKELEIRLPDSYEGYFECFVGGGALFFHVQPESAYLSDANSHLVMAYRAIRDDVSEVIQHLKAHASKHDEKHYLKTRAQLSTETDYVKVAAALIYLNKTCFNGLYRVNKSGRFNVPMGDYKNPQIVDERNLRSVSNTLQGINIARHGFDQTPIREGAMYYLDPPYHKTYSSYDSGGFGDVEHERLAQFCQRIDKAGAHFMLSNSDTSLVRSLYSNYCIETIAGLRSVSCKSHQRGREDECIVRNY